MHADTAPRRPGRRAAALVVLLVGALAPIMAATPAQAAACSTSPQSTCTTATSTTVAAGSLGVIAPGTLNWYFIQSGHDQIQSGSSSALTSSACSSGTAGITSCTGGTAPVLQVNDASGSGSGWALSAYVTGTANLPANTSLVFNGAGTSAPGVSAIGTTTSNATPGTVCDKSSSCTTPVVATSCSHTPGFSTCPTYASGNLLNYTGSTAQIDLYSASASSGLGAICFGSTAPTSVGCGSTTSTAFFNMIMSASAPAGSYTGAVINLTANTGP